MRRICPREMGEAMTEIEQKALALVADILPEDAYRAPDHFIDKRLMWNALCRAIEQHEQFKREVSDAVGAVKSLWDARDWPSNDKFEALSRFIIVKTDPLEEVLEMLGWTYNGMVRRTTALRNALAARNLEIREKQP